METQNIFIKQLKKHPFSFFYRLIKNIVFALFFFCMVLVVIYAAGNYQNFQFESQKLILSAISYSSIALFVFSLLIFIEAVIRLFFKEGKIKTLFVLIFMLFSLFFSVICMGFSNTVYYLSEGF